MATRNVLLPPTLDEFVDGLVSSGEYSTVSEVIRDGLRMLERQRAEYNVRLSALRAALAEGDAAVAAGHFVDVSVDELPGYFAKLRERTNAKAA